MLWRRLLLRMTDVGLLDFSFSQCPEAGCSWEAKHSDHLLKVMMAAHNVPHWLLPQGLRDGVCLMEDIP